MFISVYLVLSFFLAVLCIFPPQCFFILLLVLFFFGFVICVKGVRMSHLFIEGYLTWQPRIGLCTQTRSRGAGTDSWVKSDVYSCVCLCLEWVERSGIAGQLSAETAQHRSVGRVQSHGPHRQVAAVQHRPRGVCSRKRRAFPYGKAVFVAWKAKVAHTWLPSVGFRSWFQFLAVSLQVTWVINPAIGCHYFPPGLQLPSQPLRGLLPISLVGEQRHDLCEQFA